jgi:hypothetical protein
LATAEGREVSAQAPKLSQTEEDPAHGTVAREANPNGSAHSLLLLPPLPSHPFPFDYNNSRTHVVLSSTHQVGGDTHRSLGLELSLEPEGVVLRVHHLPEKGLVGVGVDLLAGTGGGTNAGGSGGSGAEGARGSEAGGGRAGDGSDGGGEHGWQAGGFEVVDERKKPRGPRSRTFVFLRHLLVTELIHGSVYEVHQYSKQLAAGKTERHAGPPADGPSRQERVGSASSLQQADRSLAQQQTRDRV